MELRLTPTAVAAHLACRHLTQIDRARREGRIAISVPADPRLEALIERGLRHEQAYVDSFRSQGLRVVDLAGETDTKATVAAMREGFDAIAQAPLASDRFSGRADVLLRAPAESGHESGGISYEPVDTKLTRETRAGTILQLCVYAELLEEIQGHRPAKLHVATPIGPETYRSDDFGAYFRFVRQRLAGAIRADPPPDTYPEPVAHCDVCRYWSHCDQRRRKDDHLSLVAGIRSLHARELVRQGIATTSALAACDGALPSPPERGTAETFVRLAHQARLQVLARAGGAIPFDVLPAEPARGLCRLPEPSPGDVFLDFEGDPFVADAGLEYLTGWAFRDAGTEWRYESRWASGPAEEKAACETFLDFLIARWAAHPELHVYHFGTYETAALRRLASRHATRMDELDRLLRAERFVDLHAVAREGLRIGIERYGLKEMEPLCGFERALDLRDAGRARIEVEIALEVGVPEEIAADVRRTVVAYNREDCLSTAALREWLEGVRANEIARGTAIPRPGPASDEPSEAVKERDRRIRELADALLVDVPVEPGERDEAQSGRWLLASMLGYFRREERCAWWEVFRLSDLSGEELADEREAVGRLELVETIAPKGKQRLPTLRFRFPPQDTTLDPGDEVRAPACDDADLGTFGRVVAIDPQAGTIDVRPQARAAGIVPSGLLGAAVIRADALEASLLAFGEHVRDRGFEADGRFRAACHLLLRRPPCLGVRGSTILRKHDEDLTAATVRLCRDLAGGVLPIQGPPGSGKTHVGARAIVALAREGRRIGITAVSHKVIDNLLAEIARAAEQKKGPPLRLVHKVKEAPDPGSVVPGVTYVTGNETALEATRAGAVVGGTAWLWARDDAQGALDDLFVDEAGQLSLAQTLAASRSARNLVLLGDPQQLEQPRRGTHPDGTDVAALIHLIGPDRSTLADDQGLFLDRTWRMHPSLCAFTSEVYYDGRLEPVPGLERQRVGGPTRFAGAGAFLVEVAHDGNQASCVEEVEAVVDIVRDLLQPGVEWTDREALVRRLGGDDVLVVAPYNAQVAMLRRRLAPLGVARVGTVDKFQGQEAPVVVYSCASSSPEDAPRGMEFLYDAHRFNVATSRARGAVIVVASPRLFEAECRTPAQMRLANGFCRFREIAADRHGRREESACDAGAKLS
jgi:predicted RecB family nuclease